MQLVTNPLYHNRLMLPLTRILYFTKAPINLSILKNPRQQTRKTEKNKTQNTYNE